MKENLFGKQDVQDEADSTREAIQDLLVRDDRGEDVEDKLKDKWAKLRELGKVLGIK